MGRRGEAERPKTYGQTVTSAMARQASDTLRQVPSRNATVSTIASNEAAGTPSAEE
jgi:hypothetical protein